MLLFLPFCNFIMWHFDMRLFILFIPAWIVFGIISTVKIILMFNGVKP